MIIAFDFSGHPSQNVPRNNRSAVAVPQFGAFVRTWLLRGYDFMALVLKRRHALLPEAVMPLLADVVCYSTRWPPCPMV